MILYNTKGMSHLIFAVGYFLHRPNLEWTFLCHYLYIYIKYICIHTHTHKHTHKHTHTVRFKSFWTDFLKIEDTWERHVPFLFKISSIGIYTDFCVVVQFLKSCRKFLFFGPSLIHQLRLLGSQQQPRSGVLLTSFSTWGTENSLAEINMEITRGDKGL